MLSMKGYLLVHKSVAEIPRMIVMIVVVNVVCVRDKIIIVLTGSGAKVNRTERKKAKSKKAIRKNVIN